MSDKFSINGIMRRTNSKSKIRIEQSPLIFDQDKPRLRIDGEEIVLLQIMPLLEYGNLIEYVYKNEWNGDV